MRRKNANKLKLINSLTEHRIRQGFIESEGKFFASEEGKEILTVLESSLGKIRNVYMLRYLFDEGEETYFFLVNGNTVVEIECEEENSTMSVIECMDIKKYQSTITRRDNILTLMIAMELSSELVF
jgi:hypothetical protein